MKLAFAISLHNIPEGISIAIPLYYATKKKLKTFFIVLISGFSEIFGAIICYLFLSKFVNNFIIGLVFSLIAGIMTTISLRELLPESFKYHENKILYLGFLIGSFVMIISHIII
ncbi:MAG: ZIP family metal transporter [Bacilli bacterium]|nr:ZIP family metal transporter [Bacilli bacterium]